MPLDPENGCIYGTPSKTGLVDTVLPPKASRTQTFIITLWRESAMSQRRLQEGVIGRTETRRDASNARPIATCLSGRARQPVTEPPPNLPPARVPSSERPTLTPLMFSRLEVDIRPGSGLGMFELGELLPMSSIWVISSEWLWAGSSLWNVIDLLRRMQHAFPLVDVKFDPDSTTSPVILHIRPHLDLLFSGHHQRLHTICLRRLRDPNPPVTLTYKDTTLSSSEDVLRRVGVSRTFGPTYAGDDLRYPGIIFTFDEDGLSDGLKGTTSRPEARMQEVKKVIITQKNTDGEVRDALDEVVECPSMFGEVRRAVVKVESVVTGGSILLNSAS